MGWNHIDGESILPNSGGNADEIRLETDKARKIRLILPDGQEPYSYFEHCLEVESVEAGKQVRTFRTIRCGKTSQNPNAYCPLCDGQQVRRRVRHACNAFDYETGSIQKLNQGDSIFKTIGTTLKMGVDILGIDFGLMKTGTNRNDTEYTVTNLGPSSFTYDPNTMGQLFDVTSDYQPHSVEEMRAIVEGAGGDWNSLIVPPELVFPTLQEALEHKMPNGKYKDMTLSQIWETDKSPRGFISYLALKSDRQNAEKAAAQIIYSRLGGVAIDGVPKEDGAVATTGNTLDNGTVNNGLGGVAVDQTPQQNTQPQVQAQQPVDNGRAKKVADINSVFATKETFIKGGYTMIIETMKQYGNNKTNINDFSDAELDALLTAINK